MEHLSDAVTDDVIPMFMAFFQSSRHAIENEPAGAAILFALALISAVLARSAVLFIPTATLALLAILSSDAPTGAHRLLPLVLGSLALLILCAWTAAIRGRFARLRNRLKTTVEEHAATKELLEREVAWRQAAEDEKLA